MTCDWNTVGVCGLEDYLVGQVQLKAVEKWCVKLHHQICGLQIHQMVEVLRAMGCWLRCRYILSLGLRVIVSLLSCSSLFIAGGTANGDSTLRLIVDGQLKRFRSSRISWGCTCCCVFPCLLDIDLVVMLVAVDYKLVSSPESIASSDIGCSC